MVQWLSSLAALAGHLVSVPSTLIQDVLIQALNGHSM